MLAFLGWNPGTEQEIFTLDELIQAFDLKKVNKGGAKFDPEKTKWFQQQYMQSKDNGSITTLFMDILKTKNDEKASKKAWKDDTTAIMTEAKDILQNISNFTTINAQTTLKAWIVEKELGFGKVMQPLRLSLVGAMQGPDVFEIATTIGKEETLRRIQFAIDTL